MKWLSICLVLCFMVAPALTGEDPYMGIVGTESVSGTINVLPADPPGRPCPVPPCECGGADAASSRVSLVIHGATPLPGLDR
jgi:hypothetical protein